MKKIMLLVLALLLALPFCANAASTYTINFSFEDCDNDIEQLNALLSNVKLKDLDFEDYSTYLRTTTDGNGNITDLYLGLTKGTFICELADEEEGDIYQIMTEVAEADADTDAYVQRWMANHPDLALRIMCHIEYENFSGFVFIYHARKA